MIQTLRAKWAWAREKPLFWANVVLIGVTAFIAILWPGPRVDGIPSDLRLRLWGIALQVVGVVTVCRDLTGTAGHFGKAGFLAATLQWLKRGFGGRNATVSLRGSMVTATGMSAMIKVRRRIDPTGTPEKRLEDLERNTTEIDADLDALGKSMSARAAKIEETVREAAGRSAKEIEAIRADIEVATAANIAPLAFGAVWVGIGAFVSTCAPEIAKIVAGQWRAVWAAL